jgi:type II secretory pathway pseudopilin PulG
MKTVQAGTRNRLHAVWTMTDWAARRVFQQESQMQIRPYNLRHDQRRFARGLTLVEVLVAFAISGLATAGIVYGYVFSINSAERFSMSLAANTRATERMEQIRSALWDSSSSPVIDQVVASNFPNQTVTLDLSGAGTGVTYATNIATITDISTSPPLKRVRVDCVWTFGTGSQLMTNTIETCRGPDQ